ncbi:hypothetical protein LCGC14_2992050, partial [marine sediment metagenome]
FFTDLGGALGFGGGGGGGPDVSQAATLTPEQRSFQDLILSQLQGLVPSALTPFTGQRTVGPSGLQQAGFGLAGGLIPGISGGLDLFGRSVGGFDPQQGLGFLGQAGDIASGALRQGAGAAGGAIGRAGRGIEAGTQPFDPQTIIDALAPARQLGMNVFEQDVVPFLSERFGATSRASGAFNKAVTEAGANLGLGLSAQAAPFIGQGALQAPGLQLQGAGLNLGAGQLGLQAAGQGLQGAGLFGNLAQVPGLIAGQGTQLGGQSADLLRLLFGFGGEQRGISQQQLSGDVASALDPRSLLGAFGFGAGTPAFENIVQGQSQGLLSSLLPALGSFAGTERGAGAIADIAGNIFGGGGGGAALAGAGTA